jgi:hypothetical protein
VASFEEHCEDCIRELGDPFPHVHRWLDHFFKTLGAKHRDVRHHKDGVEEVRKAWGDQAAKAAEIHIKKDCLGVVPTKEQAQMWNLFGPNSGATGINDGSTFLTDESVFNEENKAGEEND